MRVTHTHRVIITVFLLSAFCQACQIWLLKGPFLLFFNVRHRFSPIIMEDYIKYGPRFSKNEGKCTNNAYEGEAQALDCSKQSVSDMIFFTLVSVWCQWERISLIYEPWSPAHMLFSSLNRLLQRVDQSEKVWLKGRGAKRAFYRQLHPEKDGFCVAVKTP